MRTIDLHGYVLHDAWKKFNVFVQDSYHARKKQIRVITGQGAMMKEFPNWASANRYVKSHKQVKFNSGAWILQLKQEKK